MGDSDARRTSFPPGFFERLDEGTDAAFYAQPRLVTHIDSDAIKAVGDLYRELEINGDVLDLMASWVSNFSLPPRNLRLLGMNEQELAANPVIPMEDECVDDVVCCVSFDYLTRLVEVFREVSRVLRPGGRFVCTFSNRVFPTSLSTSDSHMRSKNQ